MKRIAILLTLLFAACTSPYYPGFDNPGTTQNSQTDRDIIAYIDQRLLEEYYWLDEVIDKYYLFDGEHLKWDEYLGASLSRLKTNTDDGYINASGKRVYYSYIRKVPNATRAEVLGFGIDLHTTIVWYKADEYYGFLIENVVPGSAAAEADIRRGDVVVKINGSYINSQNYVSLFNKVQVNGNLSKVDLQLCRRLGDSGEVELFDISLNATTFTENTVAYSEIIEGTKRVGYLVYTGFETYSDDALLEALRQFDEAGIKEVIVDLRTNGGGAVNSAVKFASALLPASYEGAVLCEVRRNPKNARYSESQLFTLTASEFSLDLDHLTVITSNQSASASELMIAGLRGLDIPVTVVGATTNGKNCGMDVTYRTIGTTYLEYAPITFMCLNAKGESNWGDGIRPDVDVKALDETYPLPLAPWGSRYDVALLAALESVGYQDVQPTRAMSHARFEPSATIAEPVVGMRLYPDDEE